MNSLDSRDAYKPGLRPGQRTNPGVSVVAHLGPVKLTQRILPPLAPSTGLFVLQDLALPSGASLFISIDAGAKDPLS